MSKINTNKEQPDLLGGFIQTHTGGGASRLVPFERNATNHA